MKLLNIYFYKRDKNEQELNIKDFPVCVTCEVYNANLYYGK